ncbi:sensor histidine kinase [Paenibacillus hexagrammi]|uniref:histidine kinase n=1 Tax=Paenibacillus hexagrammi TaxID=2908839 RepID=A0ABY3SPI7_9BACL|nr:sensor histidine kinase [Paenibacillus sp. YPD9-1]UJF34902.1 sensor histidine kinase [Paenibacillus sp. YPD9-1]
MSIHRKLFIFIPLLVLLMSFVSYFLFESSKSAQESYFLLMDRILLYKQVSRECSDVMKYLYRYDIQMDADTFPELQRHVNELTGLREQLAGMDRNDLNALPIKNYINMLDTFMEQITTMIDGSQTQDSNTKAGTYLQAEKVSRFIGEEGQGLVDLELEHYRPLYEHIMQTTSEMNKLGVYLVFTVALLSIVGALWLSSSISIPIRRLVLTAKQISKGKLDTKAPELHTGDEIEILGKSFNHMLDNIQDLMAKNMKSLENERLVKELELKTLQSQINPHFLFNTLNAIAKLAYIEGAERTSELTVSVSRLLRYNLQKLDHPVTLRDEVGHAMEYMTIQKARFRDRIHFVAEIDETALDQIVPCLTLQPILENAIVHGIEDMEEGAELTLSIVKEQQHVRVDIKDNGKGMDEEIRAMLLQSILEESRWPLHVKKQSTGLGTANVFKRLQLFFDGRQSIDIISSKGAGTIVRFRLPSGEEAADTKEEEKHVPVADS